MCGICGYLNFDHKHYASADLIRSMADALIHRGPDEYGHYEDRGLGLGFRRLSIIDLVTGSQPMKNEDSSVVVVFNGEIYNYMDIKKGLLPRHKFATQSDTEVLVHLYEEKSERMLDDLNGMFAFAIWDRNRQRLFCARDRAGQKPFYYTIYKDNFVFASELKSLLRFSTGLNQLDDLSLMRYLAYEYVPSPHSIFKNIRKLPAGHTLSIGCGGDISIKRYWDIRRYRVSRETASEKKADVRAVSERLDSLLAASVKRHLVSDVPLGLFLSGGLDSSSILYMMTRFSDPRDIKTFSIGFQDSSFDESSYANYVAGLFNTDHKTAIVTEREMQDLLPEIAVQLDEPFADASLIPTYFLCRFTRQHVTVALAGDGGDELFAGYPTFQAQRIAQALRLLPIGMTRSLLRSISAALPVSTANLSFDFRLKQFIPGLGHAPEITAQIWLGSFCHEDQGHLLNRDISAAALKELIYDDIFKYIKGYDSLPSFSLRETNAIERSLNWYFSFYLQDDILAKTDRASMANSLEVRSPLLDRDILEYVPSIDNNLKLRGLSCKYIFKTAMKGKLPDRIIRRTKKGFGIPVARWFKGRLKDLMLDVLDLGSIRSQGLFDPDYVQRLIKEHLAGKKDNRKQLWTLFMFQLWYNEYCD